MSYHERNHPEVDGRKVTKLFATAQFFPLLAGITVHRVVDGQITKTVKYQKTHEVRPNDWRVASTQPGDYLEITKDGEICRRLVEEVLDFSTFNEVLAAIPITGIHPVASSEQLLDMARKMMPDAEKENGIRVFRLALDEGFQDKL